LRVVHRGVLFARLRGLQAASFAKLIASASVRPAGANRTISERLNAGLAAEDEGAFERDGDAAGAALEEAPKFIRVVRELGSVSKVGFPRFHSFIQ
jgi:hypothetical protein